MMIMNSVQTNYWFDMVEWYNKKMNYCDYNIIK